MPDPQDVLDGLDPQQQVAAQAVNGPVCLLAGAGTGKTRAITHRIAYGVLSGAFPPSSVLAVTFTVRAAGELRARLRDLGTGGVQARTFHSAALRQLAYFWPRVAGESLPRVVDSKARLLATAASTCGIALAAAELRDVAGEIEWAKVSGVAPEDYERAVIAAEREVPRAPVEVANLYGAYEDARAQARLLDFEHVLLLLAALLEERSDVANEVRERYRHFVVDEYQDVNPLQQRLLDAWVGGRSDVCVVGDPNQTIYSFAGASPAYLLDFLRRYPEATVVHLERAYRSTPQIVRLANRLLADTPHRIELVSQRANGPGPVVSEYADEAEEAQAVAQRCRELVARGIPPSQIAVLFRINAQSPAYEAALADAGVPYAVRGGERFFDRPEVREAIVHLRAAVRTSSDRPVGDAVREALAAAGWASSAPPGVGARRERWESLAALARLAEEQPPGATLEEFVSELGERAAAQQPPLLHGVTLASLHAAKGLEWDAVFLVGLVEGMVPLSHARTPEQVAEERRLLYVGVTRARNLLFLSWALTRSGGRARAPSRFVTALRGTAHRAPEGARGKGGGAGPRRARPGPPPCRVCGRPIGGGAERKLGRCARCPGNADESLVARLKEWRSGTARALKQPAYCVLTDATLTAIAECRPTSVSELAGIPGVGASKLARFGPDLLGLLALPDSAAGSRDGS